MKLLILPNYTRPQTFTAVHRILIWARQRSVAVVMEEVSRTQVDAALRSSVTWVSYLSPALLASCSAVLAVGGDGTVIRAASSSAKAGLPLIGVNTGTLGFLAQLSLSCLEERLELFFQGHYTLETRMALAAVWPGGRIPFALNDIVLQKPTRSGLACMNAYYGDELVGRYRADGLVISTATGSTAYAYATGGPIVEPSLEIVGIAPICPQNRMNIPLICSIHRSISISAPDTAAKILADGADCGLVPAGATVSVDRSAQPVLMVRFEKSWGVLEWQKRISML